MNYFDKLPSIVYNGYTVKNLMARATLSNPTKNNKLLYYPYTIKDDERADIISYYYYDDPGYTWLIWLTNNIVDPYYGLPLNQDDLLKTIISKYGSQSAAMRKIKCYRNNWYDNTDTISIDVFGSLTPAYKKYYDPVVNSDYSIAGYKRKRHDDLVTTNRTVSVTLTSSATFTQGEEVRVNSSNYGFVTASNGTTLSFNNITGTCVSGNIIVGQESGATATISSVDVDINTIAGIESQYWSPVTFYDFEVESNEAKKHIQLLDARYRSQAESSLKGLMKDG